VRQRSLRTEQQVRHSPGALPAAAVVGQTPSLREPRLLDGALYWLEQRPHERGRTTLMRRRSPEASAEELTSGTWNLRCRVHEYGGGSCALGHRADGRPVAVFSHDGDRSLWLLNLEGDDRQPVRLGPSGAYGGGIIDPVHDRWIGVLETGSPEGSGPDQLVAIPLGGGEPQLLRAAADFCGYPALSPSGRSLAWVEWQQPWMPWERSQLWLAPVDAEGQLGDSRVIAGSGDGNSQGVSVFQPLWTGDHLVVANDRSGFWNLERLNEAESLNPEAPPTWQPLLPMEAEFAMPQWVFGMGTHAWDGEQLLAMACLQGRWQLGRVELPGNAEQAGRWQPLAIPFDDLAGLCAERGRLACIASQATTPSGLLEVDLRSGGWWHTPASACPLELAAVSRPEELWFAGHGGRPTQAWYYPPTGGARRDAPLLVKSHSGPTSMARTGLSLGIQFWTSRGWGVVDVNYGGSTGFGRAYRERLNRLWGVVDVADCAAAARALVAAGKAAAERIAIEGGSAGGFTTLAALCFTDVFRAGACRYGVADLGALAQDSHRFEARYLDGLVGPWPVAKATYDERSPLQHADRIRCPVIFFQGLDDVVVPPEQTERMAAALEKNGVPVEVHRFPGEGHGFRNSATQIQVLEATEGFFRRHFGL
jgi:dipeptidyl aminopeptidase/acylaminoacyl peptidase